MEVQIQNRIQFKKSIIEKASTLQGEIAQTEKDPEFLNETSLETMKGKLESLNKVLKKIQVKIPEESRRELQCVRCVKIPEIGSQVFSCLEHHLICSDCVKLNLKFCLKCDQKFGEIPIARNSLAERMIRSFKS